MAKRIFKKSSQKSIPDNTQEKLVAGKASNRVPFAVVEAYKSIRIQLVSLLKEINGKVVVFTSPNAAEGKSTTAINIAITLSQLKRRVIIVDTDVRRSSVHKKLRIENKVGCGELLDGRCTFEEAVVKHNPYLDVLTAGTVESNSSDFLGSSTFDGLIERLREDYDYVIIDTPPVNVVADTLAVAQKCDGVVLVARCSVTGYKQFNSALNALKKLNIRILGTVINGEGASRRKSYSYYKYGKYGYYK